MTKAKRDTPIPVEQPRQEVRPINARFFGQSNHMYSEFSAEVPGNLITDGNPKILEQPRLWVNHANFIRAGSEVRVLADDCSFRALLLCTFVQGSDIRMKVVHFAEIEEVDYDAISNIYDDYQVKMRGIRKWCIQKISTSEFIVEDIPTQSEAHKWLESYIKALAA